MKFSVSKEILLKQLQLVVGVVERRQTLPILANVLIQLNDSRLAITGTDLEVEVISQSSPIGDGHVAGEVTAPARKLLDICRSLPDEAKTAMRRASTASYETSCWTERSSTRSRRHK